jgi:hypothetical protein
MVNTPASLGSVGATTRLFPSMTLGCGAPGGNSTSDNISPMHLMNIKRVAWESTPVPHAPKPLPTPVAKPAPPPAPMEKPTPAPSIAAAPPTPSAPAARAWTPTSAKPTGPLAAPDRAVVAKVVERFLAQKGVPKGATATANPGPPSNPHPTPGPSPAPKPADFVSESDVRAAMGRSERIYISPRTIVTPAARDLGNDHSVFVETDAPASPSRRGD